MRDGDVQPIRVVVADVLPVHLPRPQGHTSLRNELFHTIERHFVRVGGSHLTHTGQTRLESHENKAHEDFEIKGSETVARSVEPRERLPIGYSDQAAVEGIRPRVVGAGDAASAVTLRAVQQPGRAMTAYVVERAHLAIIAAKNNDGLSEKVERMEVAGTRYVAEVAHHLPALAENLRLFALEKLRVLVDPGRQAMAVFLRLGAGGSGRAQSSEAGRCVHGCLFERGPDGDQESERRTGSGGARRYWTIVQ